MVAIDFDFANAANLKEIADNLSEFFGRCAVHVKTGIISPIDSCPLLLVMPDQGSSIQELQSALHQVQQTCSSKASAGDPHAAYQQFLLSAVRINQGELDHMPCGMIVQASPFIQELSEQLRGFSALEAA